MRELPARHTVFNGWTSRRGTSRRGGGALLVCLFIISAASLMVVSMLDAQTSQLTAIRNTQDYESALYLAGAGIHHAIAELENDATWRGTVQEDAYPADGTYQATAADEDGDTGNVIVTSVGISGAATRTLEAIVSTGG